MNVRLLSPGVFAGMCMVLGACSGATANSRAGSGSPADAASRADEVLLARDAEALSRAAGGTVPADCTRSFDSAACFAARAGLARDLLRGVAGAETSVVLLDAVASGRGDGDASLGDAVERAHTEGGRAASIAALLVSLNAIEASAANTTCDASSRAFMLARVLVSPCHGLGQSLPMMSPSERVPALLSPDAGACALVCPDVRERLGTLAPAARPLAIVQACGPGFFGLEDPNDAVLFADDPVTLVAIRGLERTVMHMADLERAADPVGMAVAPAVVARTRSALGAIILPALIPGALRVGSSTLRLPGSSAAAGDAASEVVVVLGPQSVHVGTRPWLALAEDGQLGRRGDPIPGPVVGGSNEPFDPAVIERALGVAIDGGWSAPTSENASVEDEEWISDENSDYFDLDLLADASATAASVSALVGALDAARVTRRTQPELSLRPVICLRARLLPEVEGQPGSTTCVRVVARGATAEPPSILLSVGRAGPRILEPGPPRALTEEALAEALQQAPEAVTWWDARLRVTADVGTTMQEVLDALGPYGSEAFELDVASASGRPVSTP